MKSLFKKKKASGFQALRFTISKMTLKPGDIVVLRHPRLLSADTADRLRKHWLEAFPGIKCIMLEEGLDVGILTKAEIERQTSEVAA